VRSYGNVTPVRREEAPQASLQIFEAPSWNTWKETTHISSWLMTVSGVKEFNWISFFYFFFSFSFFFEKWKYVKILGENFPKKAGLLGKLFPNFLKRDLPLWYVFFNEIFFNFFIR
jgi:hypothetical protein